MKVLVLGGKPIGSCELVRYAHEQGDYVIVADYLGRDESPAKRLADEAWDISTGDVEALALKCREVGVGAVVSGVHEFNLEKMMELCEALDLPCYCSKDVWRKCVDKRSFKRACRKFGIRTAKEFDESKALSLGESAFPVVVKPVDGSGSRGFSRCDSLKDMAQAIEHAREFSLTGHVLIEEFVEADAVIIHYTAHEGQLVFSGIADKLSRSLGDGSPIMALQIAPSRHQAQYLAEIDGKASAMLSSIGVSEGPVWIEAFYKDGDFVFNEMGYRFGGSLSNYMVWEMSGIGQLALLYDYATGRSDPSKRLVPKSGECSYAILPTHLRPGTIAKVEGVEEARRVKGLREIVPVHDVGDRIDDWGSAQQVFAYLHFKGEAAREIEASMREVFDVLHVRSELGEDMLTSLFDPRSESVDQAFGERASADEALFCRYCSQKDLVDAWDGDFVALADILERAFISWREGLVVLPDKASQIIDEGTQDRVNCMPCTLLLEKVSGVKLVSVFPENSRKGLPNVTGVIALSSAITGVPMAVMDASFVTAMRTALVGGIAARRLARTGSRVMGVLGSGEQARMHLLVMKALVPSLDTCFVASRNPASEKEFVECMGPLCRDVEIVPCAGDWERAARDADIVVTAISGQTPLLKAEWIKQGTFYCHVGGWEDEFEVAFKADKIVCDSWEAVKHRAQTISRMYKQGLLRDSDVYADLADILSGAKLGRESAEEFIYFDSVGLAFTDIALASALYDACVAWGLGSKMPLQGVSLFSGGSFADKMKLIVASGIQREGSTDGR